ncbi:RNA-binding protein, partial [Microcoleus sp. HI-ES]|nr:RNA-binding protein [Microcoleus sp. HI-ES]
MSIRLYVGNLPKELDRLELQEVFAPEGESVTTKVITDRKTGKCRGFGFVTVLTDEQADQVIEKYNGLMFKENPLKIEKALPRSKGKSEKGEDDQQQSQQSPQLVSASASVPM